MPIEQLPPAHCTMVTTASLQHPLEVNPGLLGEKETISTALAGFLEGFYGMCHVASEAAAVWAPTGICSQQDVWGALVSRKHKQ